MSNECEHGQLARQCEQCECQRELAAARAELERAMRVVEKAKAWRHFVPPPLDPYDPSSQIDLENAVREWEAGR
jgi:hypothetical protein